MPYFFSWITNSFKSMAIIFFINNSVKFPDLKSIKRYRLYTKCVNINEILSMKRYFFFQLHQNGFEFTTDSIVFVTLVHTTNSLWISNVSISYYSTANGQWGTPHYPHTRFYRKGNFPVTASCDCFTRV